jgi:hypothetical protein
MIKKILLIFLVLASSACQHSPRKEYFALSAAASDAGVTELTLVNQVIGVGPVGIPEYLQHNKISYWKTPQQLSMMENHYWAEPLERGITRVLALQLQAKYPHWRVIQFPWLNNQRPQYSLKIDIQRLDAFADHAVLVATIDWVDLHTKTVIHSQRIKLKQDSSADSAVIAQTFSELLQQAANAIHPSPLSNENR